MKRNTLWIVLTALLLSACNPGGPTPVLSVSTPTNSKSIVDPTTTVAPSQTPIPATMTATITVVPSKTPTLTPTLPEDFGPTNFPKDVNPLTGLRVEDPTLLDRRPVSVKVQTFPRSQRPDWAISQADWVYDYYQNNGMTRLNAIFYGINPEQVGPVRSARLLDDHIIRMYKANFAFGGADQKILNRLYSSDYANRVVVEGTNSCPALCRVDPNGFNFLVANIGEVGPYLEAKGADDSRQTLDGMTFKNEAPTSDTPGENAYVRYSISSYVNWKYDPETGRYLRFQDKQEANTIQEEAYEPFVDRVDNQQVAADNVLVLKVVHQYAYKAGNSEVIDILLNGSGEAYAFRDGKAYKLQWSRPGNDLFTLTFPDGTPYPLKPGNTWVQVVGQNSTTESTEDNGLRFQFKIP